MIVEKPTYFMKLDAGMSTFFLSYSLSQNQDLAQFSYSKHHPNEFNSLCLRLSKINLVGIYWTVLWLHLMPFICLLSENNHFLYMYITPITIYIVLSKQHSEFEATPKLIFSPCINKTWTKVLDIYICIHTPCLLTLTVSTDTSCNIFVVLI